MKLTLVPEIARLITVEVKGECGYEFALEGLSYNKDQPLDKMPNLALRLSDADYGHNKFLESIQVWLSIRAPRFWWQEMDTYRVGISKQSQASMYTIKNRPLIAEDFCADIPEAWLYYLNEMIKDDQSLDAIKPLLPEGFMQRRMVAVNYKTLRNIIVQRHNHRLIQWPIFCLSVLEGVQYGHLLPGDVEDLEDRVKKFLEVKNGIVG